MRLYSEHAPPWQVFTTRLCLLAVTIQYVQSEFLFAPVPRKKFNGKWTVKNKGRRGWKLEDQVKMSYKICKHKQQGNQYELITPIINKYATQLVTVEFKYMFMETPKDGSALTLWLSTESGSNFTLDKDSKKLKAEPLNKFHKYELTVPDGKYCNLQVKFSIQGAPCVRVCCLKVKAAPILSYIVPENGALHCKLPIQNKCIKSDYTYKWVRSDNKRYQSTKSYEEVEETAQDFSMKCSVGLKDVPNSIVWSPDFFVRKTCPATNEASCCTVSKIKNDRCFIKNKTAKRSVEIHYEDPDGQDLDGKYPYGKDDKDPDGQYPDGKDPDDEDPDGQYPDGKDPDDEDPDGQYPDGKDPDDEDPDGQYPDRKFPDDEDPDGQDPDGKDPDDEDPDGKGPDDKDPDGQDPDGKDPDGQDPDGKDPDGQDSDGEDPDDEDPDDVQRASHGTMNNWNLRCVILPVSLVLWW